MKSLQEHIRNNRAIGEAESSIKTLLKVLQDDELRPVFIYHNRELVDKLKSFLAASQATVSQSEPLEVIRQMTGMLKSLQEHLEPAGMAVLFKAEKLLKASQESSESTNDLSNLLAIIHRDGGHYESAHGREKAIKDACEVIYKKWRFKESSEVFTIEDYFHHCYPNARLKDSVFDGRDMVDFAEGWLRKIIPRETSLNLRGEGLSTG